MRGNEDIIISNDSIVLNDATTESNVMHNGEKKLMEKLAELATKNGGDILEVGFGMHLSADFIQCNPNVSSHTIIEVHPQIYKNALEWSKDKPNTKIIFGDWFNIIPIKGMKFDGILHDTHIDANIPKFLDCIKNNCKVGTIVAFFDYPIKDIRLSSTRFSIPTEDFKSLPYKDNINFLHNQFELKYTFFDGEQFVKEKNIKSLI